MEESIVDKKELTIKMSRLNKAITLFINDSLKEYNLTRSELPYLLTLYKKDAVTQEFFSNLYKLNEATVTRALARIEKKGLIKREADPNDKRKRLVSLTEKGEEISLLMINYQNNFVEKIFMDFSDDESDELLRLLNKLFDNINKFYFE